MDLLWSAPAESSVPGSASIPDSVFLTAAGQHREMFVVSHGAVAEWRSAHLETAAGRHSAPHHEIFAPLHLCVESFWF